MHLAHSNMNFKSDCNGLTLYSVDFRLLNLEFILSSSPTLVDKSNNGGLEEKWKIQVDKISSLVKFSLKYGTLGVKNGNLTLINDTRLDGSCQWMIKSMDDQHIKIFNGNGISIYLKSLLIE